MTPVDEKQRIRALDPRSSFIVQAPAGSGKTELLTQRFLGLLAVTPKSPEEIIAITFTKKAAAEMRLRVIQALESAQRDEPTEAHKKTTWKLAKKALQRDHVCEWNIIQNPNRLRIMTIDALTFHINQLAPLLGELGCQPTISDQVNSLYREAVESLLSSVNKTPELENDIANLLLHLDNRIEHVIGLMTMMLQKRAMASTHQHDFN